ncbi:MAG: SH3 domain-containing protein [Candidatus Aminicenantes bacterium]|nr:SH3 domain-containing protein [Candidatus Aminicenantes bacterium]
MWRNSLFLLFWPIISGSPWCSEDATYYLDLNNRTRADHVFWNDSYRWFSFYSGCRLYRLGRRY